MKNITLGKISSVATGIAVFVFGITLVFGFFTDVLFWSCLSSIFIALGFLPFMISLYSTIQDKNQKACGLAGIGFAGIYVTIIFIVYYAQCTTLHLHKDFSNEVLSIIDFGHIGSLFFNYDLLGYALMALSTFLIGLSLNAMDSNTKWLKALLMIHGVFFLTCLFMPMFPIFTENTTDSTGCSILLFWCVYFLPICILGYRYFKNQEHA